MFHREFIELLKSFENFISYEYNFGKNMFSRQSHHKMLNTRISDIYEEDELINKFKTTKNFTKEKKDFIEYYAEWYCYYN